MNTSDLVINIVEPSPAVPGTGLFSQNTNNVSGVATVVGVSFVLLVLAVFVAVKIIRRHRSANVVSHNFRRHFLNIFSNKRALAYLSSLVIITSIATFITLNNQFSGNSVNADNALSISTEDVIITTELGDEAVYAETANIVTVNTATTKGYTLSAYMDNEAVYLNGDTSEQNKISAVETYASSLQDNTWGMSLTDPSDQTETIFRGLTTTLGEAMPIKVTGYEETPANDQTVLYYGAYITPDLDYGKYTGTTITYVATAHVDTSNEDITLNFHGNGLYFDKARTEDLNTVVYGENCDLAYVGGNCTSAYKATSPTRVITRDDIADRTPEVINIPGADKIQVVVDYTFGQYEYLSIESGVNHEPAFVPIGDFRVIAEGSGQETVTLNGDTITIWRNDNGEFTAKIYPVYNEAPTDISTELTSICNITKSSNVDESGVQQGPYVATNNNDIIRVLSIPGADKIRVEVEYAFTEGQGSLAATPYEGIETIYNMLLNPELLAIDIISAQDGNVSGKTTFTINGDTILFGLSLGNNPIQGFDYGFYAKLSPIYNENQADTTLIGNCYFREKIGEYKEPIGYKGAWAVDSDGDGEIDMGPINYDGLLTAMKQYKSVLAGKTVNVYAYNPYSVTYNGNGATAGSMDGFNHFYESLDNIDIDFIAPNYKRDGYGFAGWSYLKDAKVNDPQYEGTIFGPNQGLSVSLPESMFDENKNLTIYAVWVPEETSQTMQTFSCDTLPQGNITALRDERDDNVYTVAKLADGNCWMTENLRLDDKATITDENTNNPVQGFILSSSNDRWCDEWDVETCVNQPMLNTNNTNIGGSNTFGRRLIAGQGGPNYAYGSSGDLWQWYSYGNYYNWYSATAGTGTYSTGESGKEDATGSICPTGWGLPIGGDADATINGSFAYLNKQMTGGGFDDATDEWVSFPVNLVYSGKWSNDGADYRGGNGIYWSRTANGTRAAFELNSRKNQIDDGTTDKSDGAAIRCIYGI